MIIVTQGLRITTRCKYVKFSYDKYLNIVEDFEVNCLFIYFPRRFNTKDLVDYRVEVINPTELRETNYIQIINNIVDLNGIKLKKLVPHDFVIRQFIVKDLTKFTMNLSEDHCEILIPEIIRFRVDKYVELLSKIPYFDIVENHLTELCNIYSVNVSRRDLTIKSDNNFKFNSKSFYNKYLLEMIDVTNSFIIQLEGLLKDYGMELIRLPIDQNTHSNHRVTYRFTELGNQVTHKDGSNPLRHALLHRSHIEFKASSPDLSLITDFKNRYNNLDLISNFTQFYTLDKLGRNWISSVNWNVMDSSFNQDYAQEEQGTIAFEFPFSADLEYYVVFDEQYYRAQQLIIDLLGNDIIDKKESNSLITV